MYEGHVLYFTNRLFDVTRVDCVSSVDLCNFEKTRFCKEIPRACYAKLKFRGLWVVAGTWLLLGGYTFLPPDFSMLKWAAFKIYKTAL